MSDVRIVYLNYLLGRVHYKNHIAADQEAALFH